MKKFKIVFAILIIVSVFSNLKATPVQPSGTGIETDPYLIATLDNLEWLSVTTGAWVANTYFIQTANIDASATSTWNGGEGFSPIGISFSSRFWGNYDGGEFTIDGLTISRSTTDYIGLFGYASGGTISNIYLTNTDITGNDKVGGLVGKLSDFSTVSNSYNSGTITGTGYPTGGLVGLILNATVSNSYNTGTVNGDGFVGGLAGDTFMATVTNSYNIGAVNGSSQIGGLVGRNVDSSIANSYSTGTVTGISSFDIGGLVGINQSTPVTNSFWDTETSGQSTSAAGTGKTTAEMKDVATFTNTTTSGLDTAWDFTGTINNDTSTNDYWDMDQFETVNNGYPILSWQDGADHLLTIIFSGGYGSESNPYQIANLADLQFLSENNTHWVAGTYFIQTANIDASATSTWNGGDGFSPIGNESNLFYGNYNGDGFAINGLTINRSSTGSIGFFGRTNGSIISNIGLTNTNISGHQFTGTLIGYGTNSTVSNSYNTGAMTGYQYVGGLIGYSTNSTIDNCYNTGSVDGEIGHIGGLVGANAYTATLSNSYNSGSVNGIAGNTGGLVGLNYDSSIITNSYSTGIVTGSGGDIGGLVGFNESSSVTNSFWDTETSGQPTSAGGTGKTTAEMRDVETFTNTTTSGLDTAWDFMGTVFKDTGTNDYWDMDQLETVNNGYPILSWQDGADDELYLVLNGDGSESDPYQISNLLELKFLSKNNTHWVAGTYFIQIANIDASATSTWNGGDGFTPIGNDTNLFYGNYNGDGFTINGLIINRSSTGSVGFFGRTNGSIISNIGLTNTNISGHQFTGTLIGYGTNSTVSNSYNTGAMTGYQYVGGLIGYSTNSTIDNCYNTGTVDGEIGHTGGLVGANAYTATLSNSYNSGSVNGIAGNTGGLVGLNYDSSIITNSYSTGTVTGSGGDIGGLVGFNQSSSVTNSFWDTETSGQSTSAGGTSKTTVEMKTESTFTDAGWDFSTPVWKMYSSLNSGYPYLEFEGLLHLPENVVITNLETDISIIWDNVSGASTYLILASEDPYGTFSNISGAGIFVGNSWSYTYSGSKMFYKIVAVSE